MESDRGREGMVVGAHPCLSCLAVCSCLWLVRDGDGGRNRDSGYQSTVMCIVDTYQKTTTYPVPYMLGTHLTPFHLVMRVFFVL